MSKVKKPFLFFLEKLTKSSLGNLLEIHADEVTKQLFVAILGRKADEDGLRGYRGAIQEHHSLIPAIHGLLESGEFSTKAVALAAPEIVDALYQGILGREPDVDGRKNYIDQIRSGTGLAEIITLLRNASGTTGPGSRREDRNPMPIHWVHNQLHRWDGGVDAARYASFCEEIANKEQTVYNFIFDGQEVSLLHKNVSADTVGEERIKSLLNYFRDISLDLDLKRRLILPICINDAANDTILDYPIFSFDKLRGSEKILVPDADYLISDGYRSLLIKDPVPFSNKQPKAVFAGTTTGATGYMAGLLTLEKVRNGLVPRIKSAQYFAGSEEVDFKITSICQEDGPDTFNFIKSLGFIEDFWSWERQLDYKFIISMDGNGATWTRIVKSLHSNSVLIKYESPRVQFYYDSLVPWLHYIPVSTDEDVVDIVKKEKEDPGRYEYIAKAGSEFARAYLRKEVVDSYMIHLLKSFARLMR